MSCSLPCSPSSSWRRPPPPSPRERRLAAHLGHLWSAVAETPAAAFDGCVDLGDGVVAPFTGPGVPITCSVDPGTSVFVVLWSSECSTAEVGTIWEARNAGQARQCARRVDAGITDLSATLRRTAPTATPLAQLPVSEVETQVLRVRVPEGSLLGESVPAQDAVSVGHGWVTQTGPLSPGTYEIVIRAAGTYPAEGVVPFTTVTTIQVG